MEPMARILATQKVQPAVRMPSKYLPLSNLDRLISSMYPQQFIVFESTRWNSRENVVSALKRTLADVLVHYYPLAGELKDPEHGLYKIHCNGAGAEFTEAFMDASIKDLDFIVPNRSFASKFLPAVPNLGSPLLSPLHIKITTFKCGGILLGICYHHQVADLKSFLMFLQAWTQAMRGEEITVLPSHERSLLVGRPRELPFQNHELEYRVVQQQRSIEKPDERRGFMARTRAAEQQNSRPILSRYFHLNRRTILELKRIVSADGRYGPFSASLSTAAYFWRLMIRANGYEEEQVAKLACSVDGRQRLQKPQLPGNYFGNALSLSCSTASIRRLLNEPASFAARLIHDNMRRVMTSDHFRSLIDWVESEKPRPVRPNFDIFSDPVMICSSWINAPLYDLDLGLGRHPDFLGCGAMPEGVHNVLWLNPSPRGPGNILVEVHIRADALSRLETDPEFDLILSSHREFMNEYQPRRTRPQFYARA